MLYFAADSAADRCASNGTRRADPARHRSLVPQLRCEVNTLEHLDAVALVGGASHNESVVQAAESGVVVRGVSARRPLKDVDAFAESDGCVFQASSLLEFLTELIGTRSWRCMRRYRPESARRSAVAATAAIRPPLRMMLLCAWSRAASVAPNELGSAEQSSAAGRAGRCRMAR